MRRRHLLVAVISLAGILFCGTRISLSEEKSDEARIRDLVSHWRLLAEIALQGGRPDRAIDYNIRTAQLTENKRDIDYAAVLSLRYERFRKALPLCRRLIAADPSNPPAYYRLAVCHEGLGDIAARDKALERAVQCLSKIARVGFWPAYMLSVTQDESMMRRAIEDYWAVVPESRPDLKQRQSEWPVLKLMTESLLAHGEYEKAVEVCRRRLFTFFRDAGNLYPKIEKLTKRCEALLLFSKGKYEAAAAGFRAIYRADDRYVNGEYGCEIAAELYRSLKKLGRDGEAEKIIRERLGRRLDSISENPKDCLSKNNVAWFYALCRDKTDEGVKLAREAVKGEPDNHAYQDTLAELLYQAGQYEEALEYSREALGVHPSTLPHFWRQYKKMKAAVEENQ